MRKQRQLLCSLFRVAAGESPRGLFKPGVYHDLNTGKPILYIASLGDGPQWTGSQSAREALAAVAYNPDAAEDIVNRSGVTMNIFSTPKVPVRGRPRIRPQRQGENISVPVVRGVRDLYRAILAMALVTTTPQGDVLADRISKCIACQQYFLSAMRRPSRFCSHRCRKAAQKRIQRRQNA